MSKQPETMKAQVLATSRHHQNNQKQSKTRPGIIKTTKKRPPIQTPGGRFHFHDKIYY
ncbi:hypothetical protein ACQ0QQ_21830 [Lysinibacillus sphaericus]